MTVQEVPSELFTERDPDFFILTSDEDIVMNAAWTVLRAFEQNRASPNRVYVDDTKAMTLAYLGGGGEERPVSGIFAVELRESFDADGKTDLLVSNRNGSGNENYRQILRAAVETVGVEEHVS